MYKVLNWKASTLYTSLVDNIGPQFPLLLQHVNYGELEMILKYKLMCL